MAENKDKKTPVAAAEKPKPAAREPSEAARVYDKLVHINTTGWPTEKIVEHKKKCVRALAAKQAGG